MALASSRVGYSLRTVPRPCHGISRKEKRLSVAVISWAMVCSFGLVLLCADIRNTTPSNSAIGRAHVCTTVTNATLVCRLLLEKITNNRSKYRQLAKHTTTYVS